jgi:cytochrome c551/c552
MKKAMFTLLLAALVLSGAAMAQDVLGPHNVNGHGCASCHAPHNGSAGNGGSDATTGNIYLWGRSFIAKTYTQSSHSGTGNTIVVPATITNASDPLFHTAACLSCHDGSVTVAGMTGNSVEAQEGVATPTYIAKDDLTNDHPVHVEYTPGGYNWPATVTAGVLTWGTDTASTNFTSSYGRSVRFYADAALNKAMVECSTCHNPHAMNKAKGTFAGTASSIKNSKYFIRGWFDSGNANSNSATQFCRQCHYSKSNENLGVTVPTT